MVLRYYRSRCSSALLSTLYALLLFQCIIISVSSKTARLREDGVSRKPIYVVARSENNEEFQPETSLYARHRRKLPNESNDQLNTLDEDVPLQEYQGVFGRPGIDFPVLSSIPVTKFNCRHVKNSNTGYYADTETHCQVFHVCDAGRKISFLCPNGTIFRQSHLICDWWFRVDCERAPELYEQSVQQLEADQNVHKHRVEAIASAMQHAVSNNKNVKESRMLLPSPVSVTNRINENFNSESELPGRNDINSGIGVINDQHNLKSTYKSNSDAENQNKFSSVTSPPRISSFGTSTTSFGTDLPTTNIRFQNNENTRSSSGSSASFTFSTTSYKPDATPLIHNFLQNDSSEYFREQQILAETASFAGKGQYPFQNYYYSMNLIKHPSKETTNKGNYADLTTSNLPADTTQYQTESYTDIDESFYRTTNYPANNYRDLNVINSNNISENDNSSYALYFSSMNGVPLPLSLDSNILTTQTNEIHPASPSLSTNASKPAVSEFILNTQQNTNFSENNENEENPAEQNLPLLTNMTQEVFNQLFPKETKENITDLSNLRYSDLATENSVGIVQSNNQNLQKQESLSDKLQFQSSPDLRELAQVFSRALSAYLENPEQFRKILSEVRPTEPPSINEGNINGEASAIEDEVLAFSEDIGTKSTTKATKTTASKTVSGFRVDQVTFTTPAPVKTTIKNPETFAEEINNFMFADTFSYPGHSESSEFNVNETYYPSSPYFSNVTTLPASFTQFTISPLIDFTRNSSVFTPSTTFSEIPATTLPNFNGIPKGSLYDDPKNQKYQNAEVSQSLSDKEHFIAADTQSFVSRDNLLKYQNLNSPNYKFAETTQNFKPSLVNQLKDSAQSKYNSDYQSIKSSKNMQFGMRTTAITRPSYISSRADLVDSTTPSSLLTTRTFSTSKATTYHPEVRSAKYSTINTIDSSSQKHTTVAELGESFRQSKSFEKYQDLSPNSATFNETAKALINMMEEAKSNNMLRHQLVLLLVNDKGLPTENKSVKEMKSKLLKALLKPSEKNANKNYKDERFNVRNNSTAVRETSQKTRKERVVVHKHKIIPTPAPLNDISSKSTSQFQMITRSERSTSKPVVVPALRVAPEPTELSDSDTRAVDLLKTLYMIASNNWAQ